MSLKNVLTVDVEDYFHVSAMEPYISRDKWDSIDVRVEKNIEYLLELFRNKETKATFFILGWVAERFPEIVNSINKGGHEIGSHGYSHKRLYDISKKDFENEITRTKDILEDISGKHVRGYRAPSFSVSTENLWIYEILEYCGYEYSSSINPIKHDIYGMPHAPRYPFRINKLNIVEIPVSTIEIRNIRIPCGGGGYFRLIPYYVYKQMIDYMNNKQNMPCLFYFHPWEIDPEQPRVKNINIKSRIRHYINLTSMKDKIGRLLDDFEWDRMDHAIVNNKMAQMPVISIDSLIEK